MTLDEFTFVINSCLCLHLLHFPTNIFPTLNLSYSSYIPTWHFSTCSHFLQQTSSCNSYNILFIITYNLYKYCVFLNYFSLTVFNASLCNFIKFFIYFTSNKISTIYLGHFCYRTRAHKRIINNIVFITP